MQPLEGLWVQIAHWSLMSAGLALSAAATYAPKNIRVNCVVRVHPSNPLGLIIPCPIHSPFL